MGIGRRAGGAAAVALLALGGLALVTRDDNALPDGAGVVTVRRPTAAPAAPPPPSPTMGDRLLAPPVAPAVADTVAAAGDAFVGEWRADDGQLLSVVAQAGGYGVTLGDEHYDAVMKDGRLHFPRGIDGDWLQAVASAPCLVLGSGTRFCTMR